MISGTSHGTLIVVEGDPLTLLVKVKQLEERAVGEKIKKFWRHGAILGGIEPMLAMDFHDGMYLPGKIKVTESFTPIIEDEPEEFIKKNPDGSICRVNGKVVYRIESYTQDHSEKDILIEEVKLNQ